MSDSNEFEDDMLDDDFAEDADFEELDDLDEDWEDLDGDEEGSSDTVEGNPVSEPSSKSDKTFLQKYFSIVVGGIVLVGAVLFGYAQFGGSPSSEPPVVVSVDNAVPDTEPSMTEETADPQIADLKAPEDLSLSAGEENALMDIPESLPDVDTMTEETQNIDLSDIEDGVLTPMPEAMDTAELVVEELPSLDLTLEADTPVAVEDVVAEDTAEAVFQIDDPTPITETQDTAPMEEVVLEPDTAAPIETKDVIESNDEDVALQPEQPSEEFSALIAEKDQMIQDLEKQFTADLARANSEISTLNETIQGLKDRIQSLEAEKAEAAKAPKTAEKPPETVVAAKPKVKAKPVTPVAKPSKPVKAKTPIKWQLRSAQPGKAMISAQGSNDVRSIEVGSAVPSLGRISSIALENGKWVVRGSKGVVRQ